ncbi:hypothetical protein INR49_031304 [Caranx melampygus]|nr:hypothetical protein INR49_031304 [Caranx melampygus]
MTTGPDRTGLAWMDLDSSGRGVSQNRHESGDKHSTSYRTAAKTFGCSQDVSCCDCEHVRWYSDCARGLNF